MKTLKQIIKDAGGNTVVAQMASGAKYNAVYKWNQNGIPDVHWDLIIRMAKINGKPTSANEIFKANKAVRKVGNFSDKRRRK